MSDPFLVPGEQYPHGDQTAAPGASAGSSVFVAGVNQGPVFDIATSSNGIDRAGGTHVAGGHPSINGWSSGDYHVQAIQVADAFLPPPMSETTLRSLQESITAGNITLLNTAQGSATLGTAPAALSPGTSETPGPDDITIPAGATDGTRLPPLDTKQLGDTASNGPKSAQSTPVTASNNAGTVPRMKANDNGFQITSPRYDEWGAPEITTDSGIGGGWYGVPVNGGGMVSEQQRAAVVVDYFLHYASAIGVSVIGRPLSNAEVKTFADWIHGEIADHHHRSAQVIADVLHQLAVSPEAHNRRNDIYRETLGRDIDPEQPPPGGPGR